MFQFYASYWIKTLCCMKFYNVWFPSVLASDFLHVKWSGFSDEKVSRFTCKLMQTWRWHCVHKCVKILCKWLLYVIWGKLSYNEARSCCHEIFLVVCERCWRKNCNNNNDNLESMIVKGFSEDTSMRNIIYGLWITKNMGWIEFIFRILIGIFSRQM